MERRIFFFEALLIAVSIGKAGIPFPELGISRVPAVRDGCVRYLDRTKNREKLPVPLNDTALAIVARNIKSKFPKQPLFVNPHTGKAYSRWCLWDTWKHFSGTDVTLYEATRHSFCSQISGQVDARQANG